MNYYSECTLKLSYESESNGLNTELQQALFQFAKKKGDSDPSNFTISIYKTKILCHEKNVLVSDGEGQPVHTKSFSEAGSCPSPSNI